MTCQSFQIWFDGTKSNKHLHKKIILGFACNGFIKSNDQTALKGNDKIDNLVKVPRMHHVMKMMCFKCMSILR